MAIDNHFVGPPNDFQRHRTFHVGPVAIGRAGWTAFALAKDLAAVSVATMLLTPKLLIGPFLAVAALFQIADGAQVGFSSRNVE
jgi:hypothetical protein